MELRNPSNVKFADILETVTISKCGLHRSFTKIELSALTYISFPVSGFEIAKTIKPNKFVFHFLLPSLTSLFGQSCLCDR